MVYMRRVMVPPLLSLLGSTHQAVVDLLVMRELLWSEARSVTFSFMHDCFSSISISAGRHQQHRQDQRREEELGNNVQTAFTTQLKKPKTKSSLAYIVTELYLTLKQLLKRLLTMYRAMGLMQELTDAMLMPMQSNTKKKLEERHISRSILSGLLNSVSFLWHIYFFPYLSSSQRFGSFSSQMVSFRIRLRWSGSQHRAKTRTRQNTVLATSLR